MWAHLWRIYLFRHRRGWCSTELTIIYDKVWKSSQDYDPSCHRSMWSGPCLRTSMMVGALHLTDVRTSCKVGHIYDEEFHHRIKINYFLIALVNFTLMTMPWVALIWSASQYMKPNVAYTVWSMGTRMYTSRVNLSNPMGLRCQPSGLLI